MLLTYQQLSLGHSIVSRRDRSCENVPWVTVMKTWFGCGGRQQQQYYQVVLPLAVLIREGGQSNTSPVCPGKMTITAPLSS
jgi:hypothetical protein